jgi:L-histidine N-alpha-methyltransferase
MRPPTASATLDAGTLEQFASDVAYYLSMHPRQLPSRYFYDGLGSALFEAICQLPWYTITRAESRLIAAHGAEVFRVLGSFSSIVELGPGSGAKLRLLLEAAAGQRDVVQVHLVDISPSALQVAAHTVGSLDSLHVRTHAATYDAGLRDATSQSNGRTLVAFLGSNIGNFDPPGASAFLHNVRTSLAAGDALLLGVDLVKPEETLLLAYDDPLGITAAFNRNLLVRINRELGGDFDLEAFEHRAVWDADRSRVEMHLVARSAHQIHIPLAGLEFGVDRGETIWTESSYKYRPEDLVELLQPCGFRVAAQWIETQDAFALTLAEAV